MKKIWSALILFCIVALAAVEPVKVRVELNGGQSVRMTQLSAVPEMKFTHDSDTYVTAGSKAYLTEKWQKFELSFFPQNTGYITLGFRAEAKPADAQFWADIDKVEMQGTSPLRSGSFEDVLPNGEAASWRYYARTSFIKNAQDAFDGKHYMRVARVFAARQSVMCKAGQTVKLTFYAKCGGAMPFPKENFKSLSTNLESFTPAVPDVSGSVGIDVDGYYSEVTLKDVTCSDNLKTQLNPATKRMAAGSVLNVWGAGSAGKEWQRYEFSFVPSRNGEVYLKLRGAQSRSSQVQWIAYDDFKVTGGQPLRNPSFETVLGGTFDGWKALPCMLAIGRKDAADGKNYIFGSRNYAPEQIFAVFEGKRVTVSFAAKLAHLSAAPTGMWQRLPVAPHPKEYYRVYNSKGRYLPLADKGIKGSQIVPFYPTVKPAAVPAPTAKFIVPDNLTKCKVALDKIPVELLEESGVARSQAQIRFAVPFAKGTIWNFNRIRVIDPAGKPHAAQFAVTGLWPDQSIKTALVTFTAPLKANEKSVWSVEYGETVEPVKAASKLAFSQKEGKYFVNTGVLSAEINGNRFNLLENVRVNGKAAGSFAPAGFTFVMENGEKLSSGSDKAVITVEEPGPVRLTLRADGTIKDKSGVRFRYTARMAFTAGSSVVGIDLRIINAGLTTEFTDFASLDLPFIPAAKVTKLSMNDIQAARFFQHNDQKLEIDGKISSDRLTGSGEVTAGPDKITFDLRNAALRYPKAFSIADGQLHFELLPKQPDKDFGKELFWYLRFPLCEGMYRMKWGMGFSQELTIDFAGRTSARELAALEVVPVVDRDHFASSKVFLGVGKNSDQSFAPWDKAALHAFYEHMKFKEKQREYGFLNYGDDYGERGRNWNNNEYDLPYGLLMLYLRTGNRDLFRYARIAARHQSDVDIIHAYPDASFIGANAQHGIGHTGTSYQHIYPGIWSFQLDHAFVGTNGHTWSEGMIDCWMLHGDAATMDSALLLGEHLTRYCVPLFRRLDTHERSAGWSNKAILGIYRAVPDEKYLDASKRLVRIIMDEQKGKPGGALPHTLPSDHGSNQRGTYGNTPYLMGIVFETLRQHYLVNPSPELENSIRGLGNWANRGFVPYLLGWPYGMSWDGKPYNGVVNTLNMLASPSVMFTARVDHDMEKFELGKLIAAFEVYRGLSYGSNGFAIQLCMMPGMIEDLRAFPQENPKAVPFSYTPGIVEQHLKTVALPADKLKTVSKAFNMRGPLEKEFRVVLKKESAEIKITRVKYGAREGGEPDFTVRVIAPDGKTVAEKKLSAKENMMLPVTLNGKAGDVFRVTARDDFKGKWSVESKDAAAYALLQRGSTFSLVNEGGFYLSAPQDREFSLNVLLQHQGIFHAVLMDADGKIVTRAAGHNPATRLSWNGENNGDRSRTIKVKMPAGGGMYRLVLIGSGDFRLQSPDCSEVMLSLTPDKFAK